MLRIRIKTKDTMKNIKTFIEHVNEGSTQFGKVIPNEPSKDRQKEDVDITV